MKKVALFILSVQLFACSNNKTENVEEKIKAKVENTFEGQNLLIYVGAASKPPTEEIVEQFQQETGVKVDVIFGGSGYVLSQMKLSGKGDIYFPGSSDYMEIAKRENLVYPETEQQVVYLVNAINVQKGNPKNIQSLKDLCKPGIKVAIANPEGVCVGAYAVEILEKNLSENEIKQFKKNLSNYTESCDKTASAIALSTVDAVIGWRVFHYWNPEMIVTIPLKSDEIIRIGYIPIAISTLTQDKELAQYFINYVTGEKGKAIFKKYSYFTTPAEAETYIGTSKPVGGEYEVPNGWTNSKQK
ncbi:MAG: molybdate ABC transporter substrate-binding protein [Vicingaceae bacterium]|nr:molybdate ABC transporter substrate-binding protein [Vicingaceae bacterium]